MNRTLFSASWWIGMFLSTLMTIVFIYILKKVFSTVEVPVLSNMVAAA